MSIDGILNIDKPAGSTSLEIVNLVRRLSRQQRVGHAGTLDPNATGVLPICLGQATRVISFLIDAPKTYCAEAELGINRREAYQLMRVDRLTRQLPRLRAAWAAGEISWSAARTVAEVATTEDEESWVELAKAKSYRQLTSLVTNRQPVRKEVK